MSTSKTIILAAGGTGGHIFPAEALAEVLRARGFEPQLITDHRFHDYNKSSGDGALRHIPIHTIRAGSLGGGLVHKLKSLFGIAIGVVQAMRLIAKLQPIAVVGFGGYPSFPTMLAAVLCKRRTILHEQNSVLGKVNRVQQQHVADHHIGVQHGRARRDGAVAGAFTRTDSARSAMPRGGIARGARPLRCAGDAG